MKSWAVALLVIGMALAHRVVRADDEVSFTRDIVPIFKRNCVACHLTGTEAGGLSLQPRAAFRFLVGVPSGESKLLRVKPGSPQESYLVHKLAGTQAQVGGSGERMPLGNDPLADAQLTLIRTWISQGAKQDEAAP